MAKRGLLALVFILVIGAVSSCNGLSTSDPGSQLTIAPPENPYSSKSSTPVTPSATIPAPTERPILPTATPLIHVVQPGDTLYGLALQYNISLDRLITANPGITSLLSIGTELTIPLTDENDLSVATPTPYPIPIDDPVCYSVYSGGSWCLVMAHNNQNTSLENIAVAINIFDEDQVLLDSYLAIPPLNILYPDQSLPLSVFIDADLPEAYLAGSVLLISLPSDSTDPGAEILQFTEQLSNDERSAQITGSVLPLRDNLSDKEIWIAAVGLNDGVPVGIRKWISPGDLIPGQEVLFDLVLYSLGPPIDEIQLYAELY